MKELNNSTDLLNSIKTNLIPDLYIFPDKYAPIDSYSFKKNLWIEVKFREKMWYDIMIEKHKYDKIINIRNSRYIIGMKDDYLNKVKVFSFNFNELEYPVWKWETRLISNEHPEKGWEDVEVAYFHVRYSQDISHLLLK